MTSPLIGSLLDDLSGPFRMLAGYIFGGNTKRTAGPASDPAPGASSASEKVAMTSPVLMTQQRKPEPDGTASAGNEKVAMTSPVLMTQQAGQGAAVKKMVIMMFLGIDPFYVLLVIYRYVC